MEIKVLENKPDTVKMTIMGETHTFMNLITEYAWEAKAKQASYMLRHPYLSSPELSVKSKNPKKTLKDASQIIIDRAEEFKKAFLRAAKK